MKKEWDWFLDELLDQAVTKFRATNQYALLQEKLDQMELDCGTMLTEDEKGFVEECFELLLDVSGQQEEYVYRRGLLDGVTLLKRLGVLA